MADEPVVVIGSGPCGAMAASRLVARGIDVLMLDAGMAAPAGLVVKAGGHTLVRRKDWSMYTDRRLDPATDRSVDWFSSRSLGGLSNYWTAAVPRFAPEDFTDGARLDERYVWPVGYDDLRPFYETAEQALTVTAGPAISGVPPNVVRYRYLVRPDWSRVVTAAGRTGIAVGALPMAKGPPWMAARRGTEFCSYHCVVAPLESEACFRLQRGAQVTRILWSPQGGRVHAVEYWDRRTGRLAQQPARAVVLAAGAIDSTMILLRSRSGDFPHGLGNTDGLVGRYLHDHPREWWTVRTSTPLTTLPHPLYVARHRFDDSTPLMATSLTLGQAAAADRFKSFYGGRAQVFGVQVFGTMVPTPEVGVALGAHPDPIDDRPVIALRYDTAAVENVGRAKRRLIETFAAAGIKAEIPGPFHPLRPGSSVHYGGSVRMHADRRFGVLDGWNRVRDAPNVVVCDSSCFPTGPEKNPTLTAMAVAVRAAERLAAELR